MELFLIYIATVIVSFWLFQSDWRRTFDLTFADMVFIAIMSLIPVVNIPVSVLVWLLGSGGGRSGSKVVWRKK